jgi:hypothetical protein
MIVILMATIEVSEKLKGLLTKLRDQKYSGWNTYTDVIESMLYASQYDKGIDDDYFNLDKRQPEGRVNDD